MLPTYFTTGFVIEFLGVVTAHRDMGHEDISGRSSGPALGR